MSHSSVKVYLSAIRSMFVIKGLKNPLHNCLRLQMAVRAVQRSSRLPKCKLPITIHILKQLYPYVGPDYSDRLVWTSMLLAHFALLRASEFTVNRSSDFSHQCNLTLSDVSFVNDSKYVRIHVKRSKTCIHSSGFNVVLGCLQSDCFYVRIVQSPSS